jgi:uncharacterized protein
VRAVLDVNVLVSALLSPRGAAAQIVARWLEGEVEFVVSPELLDELDRALAYPKVRKHIDEADGGTFTALLREAAILVEDPVDRPTRSADPGDDYLLALAQTARAVLVSGDEHLLELAGELPITAPRAFLESLR